MNFHVVCPGTSAPSSDPCPPSLSQLLVAAPGLPRWRRRGSATGAEHSGAVRSSMRQKTGRPPAGHCPPLQCRTLPCPAEARPTAPLPCHVPQSTQPYQIHSRQFGGITLSRRAAAIIPRCRGSARSTWHLLTSFWPSGHDQEEHRSVRIAKNNRSKSACTLIQRKPLIIKQFGRLFSHTGPICARVPSYRFAIS